MINNRDLPGAEAWLQYAVPLLCITGYIGHPGYRRIAI